jgi:predicted ABC-type ATPase
LLRPRKQREVRALQRSSIARPSSGAIIRVLAGVNGAGKSSLLGSVFEVEGLTFFNPDEAARRIQEKTGWTLDDANPVAWKYMKEKLEEAIRTNSSFAFETTLGGNTIPGLLRRAAEAGMEVMIWFAGLATPELHIARVRARVLKGGHDIPEKKIRERWTRSRENIIELLPFLSELMVFDNSAEGDPDRQAARPPRLLLHCSNGRIVQPALDVLEQTPEWAKPIVAQALKQQRSL